MTINRTSTTPTLPNETILEINKEFLASEKEEEIKGLHPALTPEQEKEQLGKAVARGAARLALVCKKWEKITHTAVAEDHEAALASTKQAIHRIAATNPAKLSARLSKFLSNDASQTFRTSFAKLLADNQHVEIPFASLSRTERKIVFETLSNPAISGHLENVKLNFSDTDIDMQAAANAVRLLSQNGNANLKIGLDFTRGTIKGEPVGADDRNIAAIAAMLPNSKVYALNLDDCSVSAGGAKAIASILPSSAVTNLNLRNNNVGPQGAIDIAAALPRSRVTHLAITSRSREGAIRSAGVQAIAAALPNSPVTHLDLSDNDIGVTGITALASVLSICRVKNLKLNGLNRYGAAGVEIIANALPGSEVTHLGLSGKRTTSIAPRGTAAIVRALKQENCLLTNLDLGSNRMEAEEAALIAEALPFSKLTHLSVRANRFGPKGALDIAQVLARCQLTYLDIGGNELTDVGAYHFSEALVNGTKLVGIQLGGNYIGDQGAHLLHQAFPHSNIQFADLSYNNFNQMLYSPLYKKQ